MNSDSSVSLIRITTLFLFIFTNSVIGQSFKITPNNNQYYHTDYIQKADSASILKIVLIFNVTEPYKTTHQNPVFSWNDGSGTLKANMIAPGKYQIDLQVVYRKINANTIALSEFENPMVIDVKIKDLHRHLIRIDYVSNLSVSHIVKKISTFYPTESKYESLIKFIYEYNEILRKYDPFCDLVFPEIITDEFSKKITQAVNVDWKKIKINEFHSNSKNLIRLLRNTPDQFNNSGLIDAISQTSSIKLNYYNAYRVEYLTYLMEYSLTAWDKDPIVSNLLLKNFQAIKNENIDSTDRNLVITHVTRNGFQINNLAVAYSALPNSEEIKKKDYFRCPTSPSYSIFSNSQYTIWVENKEKQKVSPDKTVDCAETKFKEIVLPVNTSLAIVKLQNDFGKNLKFDMNEFEKEIKQLIIKYNCLNLTHISLPVNSKTKV